MGKDAFTLEVVRSGALIKFGDDNYGFVRCNEVEEIDENTVKMDGYEVSGVYLRYLNDLRLSSKEEEMAEAARFGLGNAIKKHREKKDMVQTDFSVTKWTISETENGKKMLRPRTIKTISDDLGMGFVELLSEASLEMWKEIENE